MANIGTIGGHKITTRKTRSGRIELSVDGKYFLDLYDRLEIGTGKTSIRIAIYGEESISGIFVSDHIIKKVKVIK